MGYHDVSPPSWARFARFPRVFPNDGGSKILINCDSILVTSRLVNPTIHPGLEEARRVGVAAMAYRLFSAE